MLNSLQETQTDLPLSTADKCDRIEAELRADASRSNRKIAEVVGCDHKTVAVHRKRYEASLSVTERHNVTSPPFHVHPGSHAAQMLGLADDADEEVVDDDDDGTYWPIPSQAEIRCKKDESGGVEIWQEGQHGPEEDSVILVAAGNAVMLARHILYAAGFPNVSIYVHTKGGCVDIEDGDTAAAFKRETSKPGYGPVR
jgi:hypothetical protein